MSTSASISLSKYQISNVKQAITDLKSENTEYLSTMKRLINSTQDVHRDNQKLEQGIQLQRNYLLRLNEKVAKAPKLLEKSQLLNQQAIHRMKKYQRQISKQTRGVSVLKIRDEIEKLLNEISKIKENTNKYKQKMNTEQSTIEEINKLNGLKHDLVKMNQCLTDEAQKLITAISKLKIPTEIEKHVEELKQKMLKSDAARKKLEAEDPNFQNSNSEIFAQVDEKLKQAIPIFDDLESLFLSSSSVSLSLKQSSDPISQICSELVNSENSKFSQKSSARTENDFSSLRIAKSNLDSSSSLCFNEQKNRNKSAVLSKTMGDLLSMNKKEKKKLRKDKRHEKEAESENPIKDNRKSLMSSINENTEHDSDSENEKANSDPEKIKSESKKLKQKSKIKNGTDILESENKDEKAKSKKINPKTNSKSNHELKSNESDSENEDDKNKDEKAKSKKINSKTNSIVKNPKPKSQKVNQESENDDSESENENEDDKNKDSKSGSRRLNSKNKETNSNPKSKSQIVKQESENENDDDDKNEDSKSRSRRLNSKSKKANSNPKSKSQKVKQESENDDSEYENENDDDDDKNEDSESRSKRLNSKGKKANSNPKSKSQKVNQESENEDKDDDKNEESKSGNRRLNSKNKEMQNDDESESENTNHKNKKSKKVKINPASKNDESESNKLKSRKQKSKLDPNNENSESEQENDKSDKSKPKNKNSNSPIENSDSEQHIEKVKSKNQKPKSDDQDSESDSEKEKSNIKIKSKDNSSKSRKQDQENKSHQNNKSKSENDEPELKLSKKLSSLNKLTNLSNKSADENLYPTSSSQENFIFDSKSNQNETLGLSEQGQNSSKPKKIKRRKSSKLANSQSMKSDTNNNNTDVKNDDDDETENANENINLQQNQLSKTQPRVRIAITKKLSNKAESDANPNIDSNNKKRKRKRRSTSQINNSLSDYSSSVHPTSVNKKRNKSNDLLESKPNNKSDSYSEAFKDVDDSNDDDVVDDDDESNKKNSNSSKKNDSKSNSSKLMKMINPIAAKLTSSFDNNSKSNSNEEDDNIVLKKKRTNKATNPVQKKEIDSDSDNYEPYIKINDKNKNPSNHKRSKNKKKAKNKQRKSKSVDLNNKVIKAGINKLINSTPLIKADNDIASTETYNDGFETDEEFSEKKKPETEKSNKIAIFDSDGNQIFNSVFVDENGVPMKNTNVFDKEGNSINEQLNFDENGNIQEDKEIFDEFGNLIKSIIQLNDKFEPTNKKIFDKNGNKIKDASKIKIDNKKKKSNQNKSQNDFDDEIIEEEEECSEKSSKMKSDDDNNLNIFDKKQNRIKNPVLINSENGKPFNIQLYDSNNQLIDKPIETHSNGKPKIDVFDSKGTKINCLISVDENGKPIKPKIFDENGNPIETLKSFIDKLKTDVDGSQKKKIKIKKKKTHRLFDKDKNELKNVLLINSIGKPLNITVFNSDGEEVKSSVTFNQNLFDSNKVKIDKIIEVDSLGQPSNVSIFDSKGNEFSNLNFLIPKEKDQIESSASLSNDEDEIVKKNKNKNKLISVSIDENKRPINATLFDSDGNELSIVEFNSNGEPTKHLYKKNKRRVTKIIIEDEDREEEEEISSLSSSSNSYSSENGDRLRRSKSDLNSIFCDANGNEFKNPIFVDINDKPYNNVKVYDAQCHLYNSPLKYDDKTGVPEFQIFDYQGLPFSHVVQIGYDGNPTKFILYNINREPVTFPTLKVNKPKREKLEMVDDQKQLNIISFENPDKEEEDKSDREKKPKKSSQTKWTRSILSNIICNQLDKTKLNVAVADANVALINLEEEIHCLEEEKHFLERKVNAQIEARDKIEIKTNFKLDCNICEFFIEPIPPPDRSELYRDVYAEGQMSDEELNQITNEIENNSKYLADNIVFEQQKITADYHFPELEKIYFKLMSKNSKLKHVIDKLESHLNIVTSDSMAEYASKETRMRVRYEDSKKEKISTMSQTESAISEGSIQINDLNNRIEDQKVLIEMLKKQIAEQQRKERPDAKKLCLELDGLRGIEKKNRENLKMLEMEQNSIETQAAKIGELIDEKSMANMQQSVDDSQKQLNDIKDSFARMRKKSVKKANPLTNKYELMGLEERIKEAKKQIADVKRKESVAVNKIDKRIKILQSYGLRIPTHKRVSNGDCV